MATIKRNSINRPMEWSEMDGNLSIIDELTNRLTAEIASRLERDVKLSDDIYDVANRKATELSLGSVKIDGLTIVIDENGVISVADDFVGGGGGGNGSSIEYIGAFSSPPTSAAEGNVYKNTTDNNTYIWHTDGWVMFVPAGTDGTSIALKGTVDYSEELSTIENPQIGDLYTVLHDSTSDNGTYAAGDGAAYTANGWVNVGAIQGPRGNDGDPGEPGTPGTRGSIHVYAQSTSGAWSDAAATSAIRTALNDAGAPRPYDVVTLYNNTSLSKWAKTKTWLNSGSTYAWVDVAVVIDGNLIVQGTIGAEKISTGTLSANVQIQSSNYSSGTSGFKLSSSGDSEFNGTIYAKAGKIGNVTITEIENAISTRTIEYIGEYALDSEITSPIEGNVYKNTTDGNTYIWHDNESGGGWVIFVASGVDGAPGADGVDGADGADGTSVRLLGSVNTSADLSNITDPQIGDFYIVLNDSTSDNGTYTAGDGAAYDGVSWSNVGPIQGPPGADGAPGAPGANGSRTAVLDVYKWSATIPSTFPIGTSTYTWATGQFTAPATLNGWSLTPPAAVLGETLYIARTVFVNSNTELTSSVVWNATVARPLGASGINGSRTAILEVYKWSSTIPTSFPSGTSIYTWETGEFTAPTTANSWLLIPGQPTAGQTLWACSVSYVDTDETATSTVTWDTTTAYAVGSAGANGDKGDKGDPGDPGVRGSVHVYKVTTGSAWSDSLATSTLQAALNDPGAPRYYDVVTEYNNTSTTKWSKTKTWLGSWQDVAQVVDGNLIVQGTVGADKIDSRGLAIRDAAGNIILGAGTSLNWANISTNLSSAPAGILNSNVTATTIGAVKTDLSNAPSGILNSNVSLNSLGYTGATDATKNNIYRQASAPTSGMTTGDIWFNTSNLGVYYWSGSAWTVAADKTSQNVAASVAGQGAFATLSKITGSNIGTYIESASIDTAFIKNAAIKTALIDDAAITSAKIANLSADKITSGATGTVGTSGQFGLGDFSAPVIGGAKATIYGKNASREQWGGAFVNTNTTPDPTGTGVYYYYNGLLGATANPYGVGLGAYSQHSNSPLSIRSFMVAGEQNASAYGVKFKNNSYTVAGGNWNVAPNNNTYRATEWYCGLIDVAGKFLSYGDSTTGGPNRTDGHPDHEVMLGYGSNTGASIFTQWKPSSQTVHSRIRIGGNSSPYALEVELREYSGIKVPGAVATFTGAHEGVADDECGIGDIVVDSELILRKNVSSTTFKQVLSSIPNEKGAIGVVARISLLQDLVQQESIARDVADHSSIGGVGNNATGFTAVSNSNTIESPKPYTELNSDAKYLLEFNALGEGQINVCGENGNIERGDLIVTSSIPGKGMKQGDDIVRSITVAKARESVTFDSPTQVKMIACVYLCG